MKVCMICATLPDIRCGVGDYTAYLLKLLRCEGVQVSVITSRDCRIKQHISSANDIRVFRIVKKWGFASLLSILKTISWVKPDFVHIQYETHMYSEKGMINFLPLFAKLARLRCTFVVTMHEFEGPYLFSRRGIFGGMRLRSLIRFLLSSGLFKDIKLRALIRYSDSIIVTNEEHLRHLGKEFPYKKSKLTYIPLGTPLNLFPSTDFNRSIFRWEKGLDESDILLSYFGFLRTDKKIELLLQAFRELLNRQYKVKLLVLASIGDAVETETTYYERLQLLVKQLDISKNVIWMDYLSPQEVSNYLSCSDICVLPYESGVSDRRTSFIAAISLGLPVITTVRDGIAPDFRNHVNVCLISPNDLNQLVEAIIELADSKPLRESIGTQAKKLSKKFSWERIVEKTIRVYQEG